MNQIWTRPKIWGKKHSGQFRLGGWSGSFGRISSKVLLENLDLVLTGLTGFTNLTYGYVPENYAYLFGNRVLAAGE